MKRMLRSLLAMLLCISMLIGTTYAWFTDTVKSGNNIITAGNLDLEVYWSKDLTSGDWKNAETYSEPIFNYDNWEPGYTSVRYIKLVNNGSLAFRYLLNIIPDGEMGMLADVIDVYYIGDVTKNVTSVSEMTAEGTLSDVVEYNGRKQGVLLPYDEKKEGYTSGETIVAIAFKMQESAGNEYQGKSLDTTFSIQVMATQYMYENDSFGDKYDEEAEWPVIKDSTASAPVAPTAENKVPAGGVQMASRDDSISAYVPEGVLLKPGTKTLNLTVKKMNESNANITLDENEKSVSLDVHIGEVDKSNQVVIKIEIKEALPVGLNMGNYRFYHVEDGTTVAMTLLGAGDTPVHNSYEYDPATGDVVLYLKSFSEVALVADTTSTWEGKFDYSWYDSEATEEYTIANADQLAAFGKIVGGMADGRDRDSFTDETVKLLVNVNLGNKSFEPIGYYYDADKNDDGSTNDPYSTVWSFEGTFDGNGNKISNFIQRTWDIKGDDPHYDTSTEATHYYNDGMGLFGYVFNGTVKNLTVDNFSCDGEFTPTGVIAAYAVNSTFENIAVTNCNPRVYNTGNGGIVGIGGNSDDKSDKKLTFKNITVDNTNKISALWGSWDVACGGIMGMFRGYSEVSFENCHVGAQIDVYNDVCGNYQYYWYRYAGMMIGSLRGRNIVQDGYTVPDTTGITAKNCTVHFGDWNNYYYCELVANSLASYTHDHQFSRLTEINAFSEIYDKHTGEWTQAGNFLLISSKGKTCYHIVKDAQGKLVRHFHESAGTETVNGEEVQKEDKQIVYLPFNQLFQGDGWGVKHVPIYDDGETTFEGITILDRETAGSVTKFEKADAAQTIYPVGSTITVGNLFAAADIEDKSLMIKDNQVQVVVTAAIGTNSTVSAVYTPDKTDWTKGTLRFNGSGLAVITITDYYFCTTREIQVTFSESAGLTYTKTADEKGYIVSGSENCKDAKVVIPAVHEGLPVVGIGDNAFKGNTGMTGVIIPNTVTSIGASAFEGCTGLTSIIIPESVTTMESNVFSGCTNLVSIFCEAAAKPGGWEEDWHGNCSAKVYWMGSDWDYFNGAPHIHANPRDPIPELAPTCTDAGHAADGLYCAVCKKVFKEPTPIRDLEEYTEHSFNEMGICDNCGCDEPISFTLVDGVLTITGKGKIEPNKYGSYPWDSVKAKITSIVVGDNVTRIGYAAFSGCKNLEEVTYGKSVTVLEMDAMAYCPKLEKIVFGARITEIGQGIIHGSDKVFDVTITEQSVENFKSLRGVPAYNGRFLDPDVVWTVNCTHNVQTYEELPATCTDCGVSGYSYCTLCEEVFVPLVITPKLGGEHNFDDNGECTNANCDATQCYSWGITDGVLYVRGTGAVTGSYGWHERRSEITAIIVGDGITEIGVSAFEGCGNLVSATFGKKVTVLGQDILKNCSKLETLVFGGRITEIGQGIIFGSGNVSNVTITEQTVENFKELAALSPYNGHFESSEITWTVNCDHVFSEGKCSICGIEEGYSWDISDGVLYIRGAGAVTGETTEGNTDPVYPWESRRSEITAVEVSDGITEIGKSAFAHCENLKEITFGANVKTLSQDAMAYCSKLESIVFGRKVEYISQGVVYQSNNLQRVTTTGQTREEFIDLANNNLYNTAFEKDTIVWTEN